MRSHRPPANRWVPSYSLPSSYIQAREPVDILQNLNLLLCTNACKHTCMNSWEPGRTGRHCSNTSQSWTLGMLPECLDTICSLNNKTLSDLANKPDTGDCASRTVTCLTCFFMYTFLWLFSWSVRWPTINEPRFHAKSSATRVVRWLACETSSVHRHMAPIPAARAARSRHPNTLIFFLSLQKRKKKNKKKR